MSKLPKSSLEQTVEVGLGFFKKMQTYYEDKYSQVLALSKQNLSTRKIAKLVGVGKSTVHAWRHGANKPYRVNHLDITNDTIEYMDGLMLGDGCLMASSPRNISVRYVQAFAVRYKEWADEIACKLSSFGLASSICSNKYYENYLVKEGYPSLTLTTLHYYELGVFRRRWYKGDKGFKRVPDDLSLTPIVVLNWFLGDGCLYLQKRDYGKLLYPRVQLCTQGFSIEEVRRLAVMVEGLGIKPVKFSGNAEYTVLAIYQGQAIEKFFDYIGGLSRPNCFEYKFKWNRPIRIEE